MRSPEAYLDALASCEPSARCMAGWQSIEICRGAIGMDSKPRQTHQKPDRGSLATATHKGAQHCISSPCSVLVPNTCVLPTVIAVSSTCAAPACNLPLSPSKSETSLDTCCITPASDTGPTTMGPAGCRLAYAAREAASRTAKPQINSHLSFRYSLVVSSCTKTYVAGGIASSVCLAPAVAFHPVAVDLGEHLVLLLVCIALRRLPPSPPPFLSFGPLIQDMGVN